MIGFISWTMLFCAAVTCLDFAVSTAHDVASFKGLLSYTLPLCLYLSVTNLIFVKTWRVKVLSAMTLVLLAMLPLELIGLYRFEEDMAFALNDLLRPFRSLRVMLLTVIISSLYYISVRLRFGIAQGRLGSSGDSG